MTPGLSTLSTVLINPLFNSIECMHKDVRLEELKNIIEAKQDYKTGVADPIR